jgi:hypothetical protein
MNKNFYLKPSVLLAAMLIIPAAYAANLSKTDYNDAKSRLSAEYKVDHTACESLAGNRKDICVQEAKAKEKVAKAELEYSYTGKTSDMNKVAVARAESAYAVAKEKCDDKAGNDKDVCVKEAKAVEVKALSEAKLNKQVGEARTDANNDVRDAQYKVANEKCDSLSGDSKAACVASAKSRFGKT